LENAFYICFAGRFLQSNQSKTNKKMKTNVKKQVLNAIARCERKIASTVHPNLYWESRKCTLKCCLMFGFEHVIRGINATIENRGRFSNETYMGEVDTLQDILKWAAK
jgi:hypothetical protein